MNAIEEVSLEKEFNVDCIWDDKDIKNLSDYKEFDDLKAYFLEEIVIFKEYQNRGYGLAFFEHLEKVILENGVAMMELSSVNDEHHMHFYKKQGFYQASNFVAMGKFLIEVKE